MVIAYHVIGNALLGRCESKQDTGGAAGTPKNNLSPGNGPADFFS